MLTGSAERAARVYIQAIKRGDASVMYPPQYALIARIHGSTLATTMAAMGIADRVLPGMSGSREMVKGESIDTFLSDGGTWRMLITPERRAAAPMQFRPGTGKL